MGEECFCEHEQTNPPKFAQQRNLQRKNAQAVVEVGSGYSRISVRGSRLVAANDTSVALATQGFADRWYLLQYPQQLWLKIEGNSPISSRNSVPVRGVLEQVRRVGRAVQTKPHGRNGDSISETQWLQSSA